ncbi:cytochrome C biogenesis protein [Rhizobium sp. L1K21]|nr:cytochrome C biogenesis protein [Rhizobium sp. L1K21]
MHISFNPRRSIRLCLAAVLLAPALPQAVQAAASAWAETTGGRMRVVALPPDSDGIVEAILEIVPDEGWHTYWRAPGNGGIPPEISVDGSRNLTLSNIRYPAPEIIRYGNLSDFGYTSTVRFPLELTQPIKGASSTLKLSAFVGVCADICVPFQAELAVSLSSETKPAANEAALIKAARALLPEAPSADFSVVEHTLSADKRQLTATIQLPSGVNADAIDVFAHLGAQAFKPGVLTEEKDGRVTVALEPNYLAKDATLSGQTIGVLVKAGMRAMETDIQLP